MQNNFIIRDYRKGDFAGIDSLWQETGLGGGVRGDNEKVIEETIHAGGKFIILEEKKTGCIIGTSWITNDQRRLYLHHFGIRPEFQGKKLSHLLTCQSLKFAREKKMQIKLEVHRSNTKATALYEKCGFKFLGDYLVYIIRDIENLPADK